MKELLGKLAKSRLVSAVVGAGVLAVAQYLSGGTVDPDQVANDACVKLGCTCQAVEAPQIAPVMVDAGL